MLTMVTTGAPERRPESRHVEAQAERAAGGARQPSIKPLMTNEQQRDDDERKRQGGGRPMIVFTTPKISTTPRNAISRPSS